MPTNKLQASTYNMFAFKNWETDPKEKDYSVEKNICSEMCSAQLLYVHVYCAPLLLSIHHRTENSADRPVAKHACEFHGRNFSMPVYFSVKELENLQWNDKLKSEENLSKRTLL